MSAGERDAAAAAADRVAAMCCCVGSTVTDNAHTAGRDPSADAVVYQTGVAHRDGTTDVAATGLLLEVAGETGLVLVPAAVLRHGVEGTESALVFDWAGGRVAAPANPERFIPAPWGPAPAGWPLLGGRRDQGPFDPAERLWPHWKAEALPALRREWQLPPSPPAQPLHVPRDAAWALLRAPLPPSVARLGGVGAVDSEQLRLGDEVVIVGWPFCAATRQLGAVAVPAVVRRRLASSRPLWELSAPCHPGLDGGIVLMRRAPHRPVAVIAPPLLGVERGLHTQGAAVAVPFAQLLGGGGGAVPRPPSTSAQAVDPTAVSKRSEQVLCVRCPSGRWGSGLPISRDLVLTNAHVVESHAADKSVTVRESSGRSITADPVFVSSGPWDVAIMRCRAPLQTPPVVFAAEPLGRLERCCVIGYPDGTLRPTTSAGTVGAVVRAGSRELLVVTTAPVRPGASGGALVAADREGAPVVGLVCSNLWDATLDRRVAEIGMCIPASALDAALRFSSGSCGVEELSRCFDTDDPVVEAASQLAARSPGGQGDDSAGGAVAISRLAKEIARLEAVLKEQSSADKKRELPDASPQPASTSTDHGGALLAYFRRSRL